MELTSSILLKAQLIQKQQMDNNLKGKVKKVEQSDDKEKLHKVAEEFEAIFVKYILDGMRKAELAEDPLNSEAVKTYNSLMDYEMSKTIAFSQGFGISEALVNQLAPQEKVRR